MTIIPVERPGQVRLDDIEEVSGLGGAAHDDGSGGRAGDAPADGAGRGTAALVRAAARGDQTAWNALVDRYASMVWAVARGYRLSTADAAEVSRVTWLRLVDHLDRFDQPDGVRAWLVTTARRESQRVLRLAGREVPVDDDLRTLSADPWS